MKIKYTAWNRLLPNGKAKKLKKNAISRAVKRQMAWDKFKSYFFQYVTEGNRYPAFFLPVYRPYDRYAVEAWIFPLAFVVMIYRILTNIGWSIWRDLLSLLRMLINKNLSGASQTKGESPSITEPSKKADKSRQ